MAGCEGRSSARYVRESNQLVTTPDDISTVGIGDIEFTNNTDLYSNKGENITYYNVGVLMASHLGKFLMVRLYLYFPHLGGITFIVFFDIFKLWFSDFASKIYLTDILCTQDL
jgi:hypothetical protein